MQRLPDFFIRLILTVVAPIDFLSDRAPFDNFWYLVSQSNFGSSFGYCSQTSEILKRYLFFNFFYINELNFQFQDKT